ncbi:MAG: uncharacterized protein QOF70_4749 [Acetobacteraceae bacterium]|nr:uncharacterized protein [Acetobacteraceae bacterium]
MNVQVTSLATEAPQASTRLAVADCDMHLGPASVRDLYPFLPQAAQRYIETYGLNHRTGLHQGLPSYPKAQPMAARRDAWPPSGKPPGTDLDFIRSHHLDPHNIQFGLINPPTPSNSALNPDIANAVARAMNEFQVECMVKPEPRLRASIVVNYEDPAAAVKEIERCAGDPAFGHVILYSRMEGLMGSRRYFPIFEAATRAEMPVAVHAFGFGGRPNTTSGWGSFYIEDMVGHAQTFQAQLTSMVMEGVFERLPTLRFVLIEGGFGWVPPLMWRLDRAWNRMRDETPHLTCPPSEYVRRQVWFTTQPMEEPDQSEDLRDTIEWIGWDRLLFATDYPHWDFDDPMTCMKLRVTEQQRYDFFLGNALRVYRR